MSDNETVPVSSGKKSKPAINTKTNFITGSRNFAMDERTDNIQKLRKQAKKTSTDEQEKKGR